MWDVDALKQQMHYRLYRLWQKFYELELEEPERADYYAMRNALETRQFKEEVLRGLGGGPKPKPLSLADFHITFEPKKKPPRPRRKATPEERKAAAAKSKTVWFAVTNYKGPK